MEWVRCNECSSYPSPVTKTCIYLTSCGHFLCNRCLGDGAANPNSKTTCVHCGQLCSVVKLVPNQLSPEVRYYFGDLPTVLKKVLQTAEFQKTHRDVNFELGRKTQVLRNICEVDGCIAKETELREQLMSVYPKLNRLAQMVRQEAARMGINPTLSSAGRSSIPNTPQSHRQQQPPGQGHNTISSSVSSNSQSMDITGGGGVALNSNVHQLTTPRGETAGDREHTRTTFKRPRPSPFREYIHQELTSGTPETHSKATPLSTPTPATTRPRLSESMGQAPTDPRGAMNLMTQVKLQRRAQKAKGNSLTTPTRMQMPQISYPSGTLKSTPVQSAQVLRSNTPGQHSVMSSQQPMMSSQQQRSQLQDRSPRFKAPQLPIRSATVSSSRVQQSGPPSAVHVPSQSPYASYGQPGQPISQQSQYYGHSTRLSQTHGQVNQQLPGGSRPLHVQYNSTSGAHGTSNNSGLTSFGNQFVRPPVLTQHLDMTQLRTPQSEIINASPGGAAGSNYHHLTNRGATPLGPPGSQLISAVGNR